MTLPAAPAAVSDDLLATASLPVPGVSEYSTAMIGSPMEAMGILVDMWSDLLEGQAQRGPALAAAFRLLMNARQIPKLDHLWSGFTSSLMWGKKARFEVFKRGLSYGVVNVATQGNDLYLSWRVFARRRMSPLKIVAWLSGCLSFSLPLIALVPDIFSLAAEIWLVSLVIFLAPILWTGLLMGFYGFWRENGDWLHLLREPLSEVLLEEVLALGYAIHKSMVAAADQVGIDVATLQPRVMYRSPALRRRL